MERHPPHPVHVAGIDAVTKVAEPLLQHLKPRPDAGEKTPCKHEHFWRCRPGMVVASPETSESAMSWRERSLMFCLKRALAASSAYVHQRKWSPHFSCRISRSLFRIGGFFLRLRVTYTRLARKRKGGLSSAEGGNRQTSAQDGLDFGRWVIKGIGWGDNLQIKITHYIQIQMCCVSYGKIVSFPTNGYIQPLFMSILERRVMSNVPLRLSTLDRVSSSAVFNVLHIIHFNPYARVLRTNLSVALWLYGAIRRTTAIHMTVQGIGMQQH